MYWWMEEQGKECKRPLLELDAEDQKERDAKTKSIYDKVMNKIKDRG